MSKYHALIEDMVAQADEIDDVIMRFEGGLVPTAAVIDSSYKLAVTAKKAPTITEVRASCFFQLWSQLMSDDNVSCPMIIS